MAVTFALDAVARGTRGLQEITSPTVAPNPPTLSAVQLTSTSIRATIDGDAGVTNTLWYMAVGDSAWTVGDNRAGDGIIDVTSLTTGTKYFLIAFSDNGNSFSNPSNMVSVLLSTGTLIEQGLDTYLRNESGVTDGANGTGDRIYPIQRPQNTILPAITYQKISGLHNTVATGSTGFASARFQLNHWAATYAGAKNLAESVRLVLDGFSGSMGQIAVDSVHLETDNDLPAVLEGANSQIKAYGVTFDIVIWYSEDKPSL